MSGSETPLLGTVCCVQNCINSYGNRGSAQFYNFPVNAELSEVWKARINNPNITHLSDEALRRLQICDLHFEGINKSKWGLQKNSLPTLGLPGFSEPSTEANCFIIPRLQLTVNHLQSICRICYCQDDLFDLSRSKYENLTIEHIFNNLTNDKYFAKLTSFPNLVCLSCLKLLLQCKLLLEQTHNAATLFDQLQNQEQHCINVVTSDFESSLHEALNCCQLHRKHDFHTDNGIKNQNSENITSVYLLSPSENTQNTTINIKTEYHNTPINKNVNYPQNTNVKNTLEDTANIISSPTIDQNELTAQIELNNAANDSSSNEQVANDSPGHSSNPIIMSYSTFVRTTRRSSHINVEPLKYLDTNGGPVVVNYLAEEGSNKLNPSSIQLPSSSGRFSGVVNVPAIDIRCNMDLNNSDKTENQSKIRKHFLNSSSTDLTDITQILEVKMDDEKSKSGKIYRCELCSEEFTDKFYYKRHKKEHNTKKFMCTICQATFNTGTECSKHKMSHTRTCEVCGKSIQRKCYMNHLKTHDEGHSERYEQVKLKGHKLCNKCGRVFKRRWAFHAPCHTSAAPGKFQCDQCPFRTHYHKTLKQHLLVHAPAGDQFVCATCGDCFGTEDVLNKHMKLQHARSTKLFPCKWCPSKFETRYERTKHLTTDHGKKPLKEYHHPPTKFKCNYCSMTFVTTDNLRLHLWSHPNATDAELELNNPSTSKANAGKRK